MSESAAMFPAHCLQDVDPAVAIALQQLCAAYWRCADESPDGIGDLFTADGVLTLGSLALTGRAAIERFFHERDASMRADGRTTRHAACNFLLTALDGGKATIESTVLVYSGTGALPLQVTLPAGIADFSDVCLRDTAGRWRFASRHGRTVFTSPAAPSFAR
jgi:SnoaL-like domain